jgi:GntR family transcriptional regulator
MPLAGQLAEGIRARVESGALGRGARLPSVRSLATEVGVNVNTVRAAYSRLETEGVISGEQGRGTFVSDSPGDEAAVRSELRRQIMRLEALLVRLPPSSTGDEPAERRPRGARLLSTDELADARDELLDRLTRLDAQRADVLRQLDELTAGEQAEPALARRTSPSLSGARIRWVGA